MRCFLLLTLLPLPATAWEFSPTPLCTLSHAIADAAVVITYDQSVPLYTLRLTRTDGTWAEGAFTIEFIDGSPPQIGTVQQTISSDGKTLTVSDRGFGNVLDGLGTGRSARMTVAGTGPTFSLDDVDPALTAFRACPAVAPPLS